MARRRREGRDVRDPDDGVGGRARRECHGPLRGRAVAPRGAPRSAPSGPGRDPGEAEQLASAARDVRELEGIPRPVARVLRAPAAPEFQGGRR
jgi:hypothetical protein